MILGAREAVWTNRRYSKLRESIDIACKALGINLIAYCSEGFAKMEGQEERAKHSSPHCTFNRKRDVVSSVVLMISILPKLLRRLNPLIRFPYGVPTQPPSWHIGYA